MVISHRKIGGLRILVEESLSPPCSVDLSREGRFRRSSGRTLRSTVKNARKSERLPRARAAQKGGVGRAAAAASLEESLFHARTDVPTDDAIKRPFVKAPSPLCAFASIFPPGCEKKDDNVPPPHTSFQCWSQRHHFFHNIRFLSYTQYGFIRDAL